MLSKAKILLPTSPFARGVSILVSGTAGAQTLVILSVPLLTRLYTPDDFGLLAVYGGVLTLFAGVASLRYELAIPLPKNQHESANVLVLSLLLVLFMTGVSAVIVLMAGHQIADHLGVPTLASHFWLLPVGIFFSGCYKVFSYWAVRNKAFSVIAKTRISQTFVTLAVQMMGFNLGGITLVLGQVAGQVVGMVRLTKTALMHSDALQWSWLGVWEAARRYKQFPIFSTWSGLFRTAGSQLPPVMFAALFNASAAGLYSLAHRVLALPMSMVGGAIGQVFFSNAAEAYREDRLAPLVARVHEILAKIAMPPVLMLIIAGPELFALVFGEQWRQAGDMARWMAPWLYFAFITSPLDNLFSILEKQRQGVVINGISLALRVLSIGAGAWYDDLMTAVILFAASSALCRAGLLLWIAVVTKNSASVILMATLKPVVFSMLSLLPITLAFSSQTTTITWWLLAATLSAVLLAGYYWPLVRNVYAQ
ncbi:lipopolysaccharide biosynthesis protein [Thiohalomonas denitrificans]|uniref:lipopolysaccharide biosynthesis protein n=1 Tax=Thiohalomonas denitrificans TaxID=415747 RepID=UPI000ADF1659|nr:oligosaccharide flippase family protein [Thiohalomonas denitrificans]